MFLCDQLCLVVSAGICDSVSSLSIPSFKEKTWKYSIWWRIILRSWQFKLELALHLDDIAGSKVTLILTLRIILSRYIPVPPLHFTVPFMQNYIFFYSIVNTYLRNALCFKNRLYLRSALAVVSSFLTALIHCILGNDKESYYMSLNSLNANDEWLNNPDLG